MSQQPRSAGSALLAFLRGSDPKYRERRPAAIIRLLVMVSFYYAIGAALIMYWPSWQSGFHTYFRAYGNAAFEQFLVWPGASVRFLDMNSRAIVEDIRAAAKPDPLPPAFPVPARDKVRDTLMVLRNGNLNPPEIGLLRTSSRPIGYWPLLTILAFSLATPWAWRRRAWVLVWSIALVHIFIAFRLSIFLLKGSFAVKEKRIALVELSDAWFARLERFDVVLNDDPTFNFIAPVAIWLVVIIGLELWPVARQKVASKLKSSRTMREGRRLRREPLPSFKPPKRR